MSFRLKKNDILATGKRQNYSPRAWQLKYLRRLDTSHTAEAAADRFQFPFPFPFPFPIQFQFPFLFPFPFPVPVQHANDFRFSLFMQIEIEIQSLQLRPQLEWVSHTCCGYVSTPYTHTLPLSISLSCSRGNPLGSCLFSVSVSVTVHFASTLRIELAFSRRVWWLKKNMFIESFSRGICRFMCCSAPLFNVLLFNF